MINLFHLREELFDGYFVVFSPDERFHILLVAIIVTWSVLYKAHPYIFQLSKFDQT